MTTITTEKPRVLSDAPEVADFLGLPKTPVRRISPEDSKNKNFISNKVKVGLAIGASVMASVAFLINPGNKVDAKSRVDAVVAIAQPMPVAPSPEAPVTHSTNKQEVSKEIMQNNKLLPEVQAQFDRQLPAIHALQPTYEIAANKTGLPWQVIAALDYRESGNNPESSVFAGEKIGTPNPDHGDVKGRNKQESLELGANFLKGMAKSVYGINLGSNPSEADLKMAFVAYNRGSMYISVGQSVDTSPYVMNGFDAMHTNMTWPNSSAEPASTQGKANYQLGALTIVRALGYEFAPATS